MLCMTGMGGIRLQQERLEDTKVNSTYSIQYYALVFPTFIAVV